MILAEFYMHKCKFSGEKTQFFTVFYNVFKDRVKIIQRFDSKHITNVWNWLLKPCLKTFDYILPNLELES